MIELKHTNAWDELPLLPDASFDLICTDIPYMSMTDTSKAQRSKEGLNTTNEILGVFSTEDFLRFSKEAHRLLKPGRHLYCFTQAKVWSVTERGFLDAGFQVRGMLIWGKRTFTKGNFQKDYPMQTELILYAHKLDSEGKSRDLFGAVHSNFLGPDEFPNLSPMNMVHTTQKPVKLLEYLLSRSSLPGETVFDPFCGVATTLLAARNTQRSALGFEIDEGYYKKGLFFLGGL